ncbi:MAG: lysophospholipid acyltransferase family protein [Acidimicrobiia bacterium]
MEPLYSLARNVFWGPLTFGLRWTIEGAHTIPEHGPVILASNHTSYLDPLVLAFLADRRYRRVRFLAKEELFDKRGLGPLLRGVRQIPVRRGTSDAAAALQPAVDELLRGECVAVFPEGTISLDLDPMPGKTGTARLAQASGVAVTPVGLWGAHRILFKGRKPDWRTGVAEVISVGTPVRIHPAEDVHDATDRVMAAIAAEVSRARDLYPQAPATGEDDWWVRPPETARLRSCRHEETA